MMERAGDPGTVTVLRLITVTLLTISFSASNVSAAVAFEKLTDMDYRGNTYYTIRNLTLYECQGWCREEPECQAASFSFVTNPLTPIQETVCLLQNETSANNPSAVPKRAVSTYYMVKLRIRSDKVCNRPWTFERVPNKMLQGLDNALIFTSTKEACLAACLNEERFVCRSAEYNYVTLQCHLSEHDRRTADQTANIVDVQGVDYFENLCLNGNEACKGERLFPVPNLGVPNSMIDRFVDTSFYVDLELMANTAEACQRACEVESEIMCRSFLYHGPPTGTTYNCQLFHLDHVTLPDGVETFLSANRPLIDTGRQPGTYYENVCRSRSLLASPLTPALASDELVAKIPPAVAIPGLGDVSLGSLDDADYDAGGPGPVNFDSGAVGIDPTSESDDGDQPTVVTIPDLPNIGGGAGAPSNDQAGPQEGDINCDSTGTCYDVTVQCKDTRIAVQVSTNKPFNGRIYALGRSETCNVDVISSDQFRLDLSLSGQDCNTQSIGTVYSNTVVVQHHSVVMTKTDKIYKVRCTYDMSSKNITFGMLPIRDPDMISITSAPEAPPPRISILNDVGREVETVRIGDKLRFRIEIPQNTPYGIFARNCVAMAKDARSTFRIIDENGCPVDTNIFPRFTSQVYALESRYEAFRFTESYGVIFQCNVKYCLGPCEPAQCNNGRQQFQSWGRRKRSVLASTGDRSAGTSDDPESMTLSQEILVLDLGDDAVKTSEKAAQPAADAWPQDRRRANPAADGSTNAFGFPEEVELLEKCPTRSSVLALSVTCALLALVYICTVFGVLTKRWMARGNKVV
ncbi:uncharacterized protein LOC122375257 isoform X1 [Amphibalanus amphitrite]|uniref:uncharacterized protein LOC122375257 isoform X1 n=1 Tax=Amphibalanus amphitrite TaxID=1232801 RepID=UPI001C92397E|nr:uncharacterized protein LOC122375257 isoform X1 [Amphibalanus amphitrite]